MIAPCYRRGWCLIRIATLAICAAAVACHRAAPAAEHAPDGPALYAQACAKCHAADGTGGLPMAVNGPRPIDLTDGEWQRSRSDTEIAAAIRRGRGAMPPFLDVLSAGQIDAVAAHVRSLKRP